MIDNTEDGGPARVARLPESLTSPWGGPAPTGVHQAAEGGPVAVVYEPAAVGDTALIPYEKVDRTPAALKHLEAMLADFTTLDSGWFVSLLGAVEDKGSVALFGEVRELGGGPDFRLYRVVSYAADTGKFFHASRRDRASAERLYDQRREELS
jgi:hypothetical protein